MEHDDPLYLARHYIDIDRPQAALETLGRVSGDGLDDPEYWAVRAHALLQLDRADESAAAARRGLEADPEEIELLVVLALAEAQQGHHDEAHDALERALEIAPDDPLLLAQSALVSALRLDFMSARKALAEAMRLDPESEGVLHIRAQVAVLADDGNASRYVDELLERYPENSFGHVVRGALAAERKDVVRASRAFDEAARLDPSDPDVAEAAAEARVAAHPLLAPVRPLWRFGRWKSWGVYFTIMSLLAAAKLESLRLALGLMWLTVVLLSWFAPRFIRWRRRRRFGA